MTIEKVRQWYLKNNPDKVLLAKLSDGSMPIMVIDDGVEQEVYLYFDEETDGNLFEIEVEVIDDLRFKAMIRENFEDPNSRMYERIFTQPEKDAWIEWREV